MMRAVQKNIFDFLPATGASIGSVFCNHFVSDAKQKLQYEKTRQSSMQSHIHCWNSAVWKR